MRNKREKNFQFFHSNFFPKNRRGQFFIIMSVIIIGLVAGLATITNSVQKQDFVSFNYVKEELKFESEKVVDYGIANNQDLKVLLTDFTQDYSQYSNADKFYYVFGTQSEITFVGLQKKTAGEIQINFGSGNVPITLTQNQFYIDDYTPPVGTNSVNLTIAGTKHSFILQEGENFFFVVSKEIEGNVYTATSN